MFGIIFSGLHTLRIYVEVETLRDYCPTVTVNPSTAPSLNYYSSDLDDSNCVTPPNFILPLGNVV